MPNHTIPEDTLTRLEDRGPLANPFRAGGNSVFSRRGLVASSHTLASLAGVDMLRRGGGAMDAAIAAAATLAVVEPMMTGIGGDAFFLYYEAEGGSVYGFNGSGRSPRSLASQEVLRQGRKEIETDSWDAVTVPGAVDAWTCGHQRFGRLSFDEVLSPAIRYAEEGFAVSEVVHEVWTAYESTLEADPEAARTYLVDGRVPELGSLFVNPRLAESLRIIAAGGADSFYRGPVAAEIVRYAQSCGSALSAADFADHRSDWVEPISTFFRDFEVLQLPPNCQGLAVLLMLNLLDGIELENQKHNSRDVRLGGRNRERHCAARAGTHMEMAPSASGWW